MSCEKVRKRYRSVYKYIKIGAKEYAVLDHQLANERAEEHLSTALKLLSETVGQTTPESEDEINQRLILATDFGSRDAPFILALRVLDNKATTFAPEEVTIFLKIAAERGHAEAAYRMASSYAAMATFPEIERVGADYFTRFEIVDRQRLAEYYFRKAITLGHQEATEDLIIAYAYGRGYIQKNINDFTELCEQQVVAQNQSVTLGYAAWLAGMTVEGKAPLPDAVALNRDVNKSLDYLLLTSHGKNLQLAQHALHLVCVGMQCGVWDLKQRDLLRKKLLKDAKSGNQLLALYLAWYSIPLAERQTMPKVLESYQLTELGQLVSIDRDQAIAFLDIAFFGADEDISGVARDILSLVFGRCFMDDHGQLVFGKETARVNSGLFAEDLAEIEALS